MSQWEVCKLISCTGHFEMLQCTVCSSYVQTGKQPAATGSGYSTEVVRQGDERQSCGHHKKPCYITLTFDLKGSISQTLISPLTLLYYWVLPPICAPFPVLHVPPLPSSQPPSELFVPTPVLFEHEPVRLYLSYSLFSFPLLTSNLASFPFPGPLPPSLSLALLSWSWPVTHVGNFCGAPASDRTLIYWECWVTRLFLGTCKYENFLSLSVSITQRIINNKK